MGASLYSKGRSCKGNYIMGYSLKGRARKRTALWPIAVGGLVVLAALGGGVWWRTHSQPLKPMPVAVKKTITPAPPAEGV